MPRKSLIWLKVKGKVLGLGLGIVYRVLGLGLGLEAQILGLGLAGQVLVNITESQYYSFIYLFRSSKYKFELNTCT